MRTDPRPFHPTLVHTIIALLAVAFVARVALTLDGAAHPGWQDQSFSAGHVAGKLLTLAAAR